jgi:hypothetical protein
MNRIKVNLQQSILVLKERGWSKRRIARELQVDRETVTRHLAANATTNPALGSGGVGPPGPATNLTQGAEGQDPNATTNLALGSGEAGVANTATTCSSRWTER